VISEEAGEKLSSQNNKILWNDSFFDRMKGHPTMGTVVSDSQTMLLLVGPKDAFNTGSQSVELAIVQVGEALKIPVFKFEFDFLRPHELEDMIANIATKGKAELNRTGFAGDQ
jgi:hypothetical protein